MSISTPNGHDRAKARLDALIAEAAMALEQARMQQGWFLPERPGWQRQLIESASELLERARETAPVDASSVLRATLLAHDARDRLAQVLTEFARALSNMMHQQAMEAESAA